MTITRGPESLTCSARSCTADATWAVLWANPNIHYGRHKTWLACDEHRKFLLEYLQARNFPAETWPLNEYLAAEENGVVVFPSREDR